MEAIVVGVVGALAAIIVQGIGFALNRKAGLSEAQEVYQDTLEGLNRVMAGRVEGLEKQVEALTAKNAALEAKVEELTRQVRDLTFENLELLRQLVSTGGDKR